MPPLDAGLAASHPAPAPEADPVASPGAGAPAFAPAAAPLAAAIAGRPSVLARALAPATPIAIWRRPPRAALDQALDLLLAGPRRGPHLAEGAPAAAASALVASALVASALVASAPAVSAPAASALVASALAAADPLSADIALLAGIYTRLTGHVHLRLKLEVVEDDACRFWHVDRVALRLLCTYRGPATEWLRPGGQMPGPGAAAEGRRVRRLAPFDVAVMKGTGFAPGHAGVAHRSPPVSHLPRARRARILLVVDAPACGC